MGWLRVVIGWWRCFECMGKGTRESYSSLPQGSGRDRKKLAYDTSPYGKGQDLNKRSPVDLERNTGYST